MKLKTHRANRGSALVVTIAVVATILVLLGCAISYTQHISRVADRSRKIAQAMEVGDGHLEYLFSSWRSISRIPAFRYTWKQPSTNFFFTTDWNPGPAPTAWTTPAPYFPNPWPGTPPLIQKPTSSLFPSISGYDVTQYRIQAVTPMIELNNGVSTLATNAWPPAAYGPNEWQYSFYYLASVDVKIKAMTGDVEAKVRRVFEKKYDNPWTFAVFFNDDLEFQPSASYTVDGPIHTNASLYVGTSNFTALSKVAYGGEYVNGFSPNGPSGISSVPTFVTDLPPSQESPYLPFGWNLKLNDADGNPNTDSYRELIEKRDPTPGVTDPLEEVRFYNQASYRVQINLNSSLTSVTISRYDSASKTTTNITSGNIWDAFTKTGGTNVPILSTNEWIWDAREQANVRLATVDIGRLRTVVENGTLSGFNGVLYISDASAGQNASGTLTGTTTSASGIKRGIRLKNAQLLPSGTYNGGDGGLTIATDNPVYINGDYNTGFNPPSNNPPATANHLVPTGKTTATGSTNYIRRPSAIIADAVTVLSNGWSDSTSASSAASRSAAVSNTTINTAIVAGNVASVDGTYSGGGENFIRLLEDWSKNSTSLTYYGSMVQLYNSAQATGRYKVAGSVFSTPAVNKIFYDTRFGTTAPPGNLQIAAYLQQQRWYQVY